MKLYCVCIAYDGGDKTYDFVTSKAEAERSIKEWKANKSPHEPGTAKIEVVVVKPTRVGIRDALNTWANAHVGDHFY